MDRVRPSKLLRLITTGCVWTLLALPCRLGAKELSPKRTPTVKEAVAACIVVARQRTNERLKMNFSDFDAYVTSAGNIRAMGTDEEKFAFQKCMDESGYPLE